MTSPELKEKEQDLLKVKRLTILDKMVADISKKHPDFYYLSTIEIAYEILDTLNKDKETPQQWREAFEGLDQNDIKILLGMHNL